MRRTRALYVETPTNPTLRLVDLRKAAALARKHKLVSLIDNTFATPMLQKPLDLGFDLVVHSATKYLGGHSDLIAGAVAGSRSGSIAPGNGHPPGRVDGPGRRVPAESAA